MKEKIWFNYPFESIAQMFFLLEKASIESPAGAFFVELFADRSFRIPFRMLLIWETKGIYCQKISPNAEQDNVLEIRTGKIPLEMGSFLIKQISKLTVPFIPYEEGQGRDGSVYKLRIGQDSSLLSLQYWDINLPPAWEPVEKLVQELMQLEKQITYSQLKQVAYQLEMEDKQSLLSEEKTMYLSFRKL